MAIIGRSHLPKIITIVFIGFFICRNSYAQTNQTMIEIQNFDFLIGKWSVLNKRLNERLTGCQEWTEFIAEMECKKILNDKMHFQIYPIRH